MKRVYFFLFVLCLALLCGCGHSVLLDREVNGVAVYIPLGDGSLGVTIGCCKSTTATLRGGASVESTSTSSGGIFSGNGGVSKITNFKTNAQLNEGNLVKIMTSPDVPDAAKIILATNMAAAVKAPKFMPSIMQTEASTIHLGSEAIASNGVVAIERRSSGLDKVVETIPQVTTPIVNGTKDIVNNTVDDVTGVVDVAVEETKKTVKKWKDYILLGIVGILAFFLFKKLKSNKTDPAPTLEDTNPDNVEPTEDEDLPLFSAAKKKKNQPPDPEKPEEAETIEVEATPLDEKSQERVSKIRSFFATVAAVIAGIFSVLAEIPSSYKKRVVKLAADWMKSRKKKES